MTTTTAAPETVHDLETVRAEFLRGVRDSGLPEPCQVYLAAFVQAADQVSEYGRLLYHYKQLETIKKNTGLSNHLLYMCDTALLYSGWFAQNLGRSKVRNALRNMTAEYAETSADPGFYEDEPETPIPFFEDQAAYDQILSLLAAA